MLTEKQVEYLYLICEEHGVKYYDLQTEMVDHLAKCVENRLQINTPEIFFSTVDEVLASFGKNGLAKIAEIQKKTISESFYNIYNNNLQRIFSFPVIGYAVIIIIIFLLPFLVYENINKETLLFLYGTIFFLIGVIPGALIDQMSRKRKKYLYVTKKRFYIHLYSFCFLLPMLAKSMGFMANMYFVFIYLILSIVILFVTYARYSAVKSFYKKAKQNFPMAFN